MTRRRALRALSWTLIALGLAALADAALTLAWQEPVSALYATAQQGRLERDLDRLGAAHREGLAETGAPVRAPARRGDSRAVAAARPSLARQARRLDRRAAPGDALGRLRVPAIGLSRVVVAGTGAAALRSGPGHFPATPLPGARGTVAIAGHRTTYGAPFRRLDALKRGDLIELAMPYGTFSYAVSRRRILPATATWVTRTERTDRLVLTACHPLFSARERIVVFARLVDSRPA